MATYHLTAKIGQKGKAQAHAAYIAREGKYSGSNRYEDLEATAYGNMPTWAEHNPVEFWQAADQNERANGSTYREIEIALPRELTPQQRLELVQDFIAKELGEKHAYQFAIHTPKAALEQGEQPHAHIMYSERIIDGIERNPEQYFKRYNAKQPEKGGAKKYRRGNGMAEVKDELLEQRERWANLQNYHLEKHGYNERVDHRSLKDQGITDRQAEKHLGGAGVRNQTAKNNILELRAPTLENLQAQTEVLPIVQQYKKQLAEQQKAALQQKLIELVEKSLKSDGLIKPAPKQEPPRETLQQQEKRALVKLGELEQAERERWRSAQYDKLRAEYEKLAEQHRELVTKEPKGFFVGAKREAWAEATNRVAFFANKKAAEWREAKAGESIALKNLEYGQSDKFRHDAIDRLKSEYPELYKALIDADQLRKQSALGKELKTELGTRGKAKNQDFDR